MMRVDLDLPIMVVVLFLMQLHKNSFIGTSYMFLHLFDGRVQS